MILTFPCALCKKIVPDDPEFPIGLDEELAFHRMGAQGSICDLCFAKATRPEYRSEKQKRILENDARSKKD